jgi:hypothetical protein
LRVTLAVFQQINALLGVFSKLTVRVAAALYAGTGVFHPAF